MPIADLVMLRRRAAAAAALVLALTIAVTARGVTQMVLPPVQVTPDQLTWQPYMAGGVQAKLVGDPMQPGPYVVRLRLPAGLRIPPHIHPDARVVTVLSGTMQFSYGVEFDSSRMRAFPSGSVWTEPTQQPHYAMARDDVVLQVAGTGPSGMTLVYPLWSARWLEGCWRAQSPRRTIVETWAAARDNVMTGGSRTMRGDSVIESEAVYLRSVHGVLTYEAHPSAQASATFAAKEVGDSMLVFENLDHDFPQRIGYRRIGADSLLAWIEGSRAGSARRIEYPHVRCPSP